MVWVKWSFIKIFQTLTITIKVIFNLATKVCFQTKVFRHDYLHSILTKFLLLLLNIELELFWNLNFLVNVSSGSDVLHKSVVFRKSSPHFLFLVLFFTHSKKPSKGSWNSSFMIILRLDMISATISKQLCFPYFELKTCKSCGYLTKYYR